MSNFFSLQAQLNGDRDLAATQDETIMADGRPAFAWWNEIQMLRADKKRIDNLTNELLDMNALLRIVRVYLEEEPQTGDIVIRLDRRERVQARSFTLRGLIEEIASRTPKPQGGGTP